MMKEWKQIIVRFYVIAMCIFLPLYYENGYFNTLAAKAHGFWAISGITMIAFACIYLMQLIMGDFPKISFAMIKKHLTPIDLAVAVFGISALLSWLLSDYGMSAFTGDQGWFMGAGTLIALSVTYFIVSRNAPYTKNLWVYLAIAATIVFGLAFLNGLDIDPLGLHQKLIEKEHFEYISTIGNVNSYSGYVSLLLPPLSMIYIVEERKWLKIWLVPVLFCGFGSLFMGSSDGAFLGCGVGLLFMIYYCLQDRGKYGGLLQVGLLFAASSVAVDLLNHFWSGNHVEFMGIAKTILDYKLYMPVAAICLLLILLKPALELHTSAKSDRILSIIVGGVALAAILVMVIYNAMNFDGKWGTKRGWIWQFAIEVFAGGSVKDKLIGVGADCFGIPVTAQFGEFISQHWGKRIANAHNEYLQYLVTTGLLGLVSYAGIYLRAFISFVKRLHWKEEKAALFFGIMAYMAQAIVNNPQALNMGTMFLFLAIFKSFGNYDQSVLDVPSESKSKHGKKAKKKRKR